MRARRTLSADFFAGADALVRRAEISVLIFFEDCVCLEATRTPVKDEVNMVSVCFWSVREWRLWWVGEIFLCVDVRRALRVDYRWRADETRERG